MSNYGATVKSLGPSLYMPMQEPSGTTILDHSNNYRNGTYNGVGNRAATGPLDFQLDYGLDFDGSNDVITTTYGSIFTNGTSHTFAGWAYRDTQATYQMLVAGTIPTDMPRLYLGPGGGDVIWEPDQGGAGIVSWAGAWPSTGRWVHWVLEFLEGFDIAALFIDGVLIEVKSCTDQYQAAQAELNIGCDDVGGGFPFDGKMAHFAVWNRYLVEAEVRVLYKGGRP